MLIGYVGSQSREDQGKFTRPSVPLGTDADIPRLQEAAHKILVRSALSGHAYMWLTIKSGLFLRHRAGNTRKAEARPRSEYGQQSRGYSFGR